MSSLYRLQQQAPRRLSDVATPPAQRPRAVDFDFSQDPEQMVTEQQGRVDQAIESGDYRRFTRELHELQARFIVTGFHLPEVLVERMKDRARMFSFLKEAFQSVKEGRLDLAASELRMAKRYADRIQITFEYTAAVEYLGVEGAQRTELLRLVEAH